MISDEYTVLDIVQDAYIKAFGSLSTLEEPEKFVGWVRKIASNKAKDYFKKKRDKNFSELGKDEDDEGNERELEFEDESPDSLPEAVIDQKETARLIDEILGTLSDEQRMAVGMYYYQDMSVSEIAEELRVSENTVKSRLNYARKKIRAGVEELEKRGTKLYGLTPIPFLVWLFKSQIANPAVGGAPAAVFENIMAGTSAASAAASTAASTAAAASSTSTATAATSAASAASTSAASSAAGAAAAKTGGLFATLGAKITAGVVAAAIVGGGAGTAVYMARRSAETSAAETKIETTAPSTESVSGNASEAGEYLANFLEGSLIPQFGIYDACQPAYFEDIYGAIDKTTFTFDPETRTFSSEHVSVGAQGSVEYPQIAEEFENAGSTINTDGIYGADIDDYDGDGEPELFVIYGSEGNMYLEMVEFDNGFARKRESFDFLSDEMKNSIENYESREGTTPFSDFRHEYITRSIGKCKCEDGRTYIIISDETNQANTRTPRYLRLSCELDRLSCMIVDVIHLPNESAVEFYYNGEEPRSYDVADYFNGATETVPEGMKAYIGGGVTEICRLYQYGAEPNDFIAKHYKYKGGEVTPPPETDEVTTPPETGSEEPAASEGLAFELNDDGVSYALIGMGSCTDVDIVIPDTYNGLPVTRIGDSAFYYDADLRSVVVPEGVTSIGEDAFANCSLLENVTLPGGLTTISGDAFINCHSLEEIDLPDSVSSIGEYAFGYCTSLTSVRVPNGVTVIEERLFLGCTHLTEVTLPEGITTIKSQAFEDCMYLERVNIPDSVTEIGDRAFYYSGITEATIPSGVKRIENDTFNRSSLARVILPDGLESIGKSAFEYCSALTSVDIPGSVTEIGDYAFSYCAALPSIDIPDGVTTIGQYSFLGCDSLTEITISDSVTSIGQFAFSGCLSVTEMTIPGSVTEIGLEAFNNCPALQSVTFRGTMAVWRSFDVWSNPLFRPFFVVHCDDGDVTE